MPKYIHYITVPFSSSVNVVVESDEEIRDSKHAYELATDMIYRADTKFSLENEPGHRGAVELGDDLSYHEHMNRGNVCVAVCSEVSWETEGEE